MRKYVPYAGVFVFGMLACLLTVDALHGAAYDLADSNKNIVLARLEQTAPTTPRIPEENVIARAAATIEPSIVRIAVVSKPIQQADPFGGDPFFRHFFGGQFEAPPSRQHGVGSGVVISEDGYILTNNHVVENADEVNVTMNDGKAYRAKVIGTDPSSDIAVVKVNATTPLHAADFANSKDLEVGDMVIAAGDPLDIGTTVTFGIISAVGHRNSNVTGGGPHPLASDIIQTDAAINPGNSGGALADMSGKVVGINEAIISPTGSYVGIGLAIPINTAKDIAYQLIKSGKVVRPYLGVGYMPIKGIDEKSRQQVGITLKSDDGVVVTQVYPDSPAAKAGLRIYDVILDANGKTITDDNPLQPMIGKLHVGDSLVLRVARGDEIKLITVPLGQMPDNFGAEPQTEDANPLNGGGNGDNNGGDQPNQ